MPLGGLPLSAGLSAGYSHDNLKDLESGSDVRVKESYYTDLSAEIKAWVPGSLTGGIIKPYAKYSHSLLTDYKRKVEIQGRTIKTDGDTDSYRVGAGVEISLMKTFGVFGEYNFQKHTIKATEKSNLSKTNWKGISMSRGVLLGATARI